MEETAAIMNLKRWFAWLCLTLMLVSEIFLFRALHEKETAQTDLHAAQAQIWQLQKDLDELKNSNAGLQASEILRLRKQNEIYSNQLAQAQTMMNQLTAQVQETAENLTNARAALQLQQEHLQQLQSENKLVTDAGITIIHRNACINNLRQIDAAKQQWALEKNKSSDDVPTVDDLVPYLKDGVFPICPDGGTYSINEVDTLPTCTIQGHVLPQ